MHMIEVVHRRVAHFTPLDHSSYGSVSGILYKLA